ncbi:MAG: glutathione S-transferase [Limimaricola sp.]|uniref:glutathione S-transferase family protein n=1 Tax=Limimaricola sp. TaxID=2211665 RepID=UPI001DE7A7C2|nr:glutathione S-transferase family protein [Limimaricola sp.]MBI1416089.1 glutathione S-transferase [Limimaricola sp.]
MITVYGEGRGLRVVWLLEEMGLPYRLRDVDLLADVTQDTAFMALNPAGFIPALVDGAVTMVESIAIMEYLMARHGPTPLMPAPEDAAFPAYKQFLLLGEAGLGQAGYFWSNALRLPEGQRDNPTARHTKYQFDSRLKLVERQLAAAPYMAGAAFTAADISVAYALDHAHYSAAYPFGPSVRSYLDRLHARPGYQRALAACPATRGWYASTGR